MSEFADPVEVEGGGDYLKPADLRGQVCLVYPTGTGSAPGKPDPETGEVKPWEWVECSVATLDRAGIVAYSPGVRISWTRCRKGLSQQMETIIGGKFTQEEGSSAVVFVPLEGQAREVAAKCVEDFKARLNGQSELAQDDDSSFDDEPPF